MNFYIADTHFGHHNVIRYDNRPFRTTAEMDNTMIDNWNKVVGDNDTVYILGDFSWYGFENTVKILDSLRGDKVLIRGNHDRLNVSVAKRFFKIENYLEITDGKERVVLNHYPMPFWNGQFRNTVHLYGHVHNSHQHNYCLSIQKELAQLQDIPMRMYNVGCMIPYMDYTPRTLEEILDVNEAVYDTSEIDGFLGEVKINDKKTV